ncbi:acyl-CoA dehydrogenase family protein [Mesorhizobium xinjiangense]|uniref:acyl-CoA dehydrogenase family protein n=1 Tax=Mesorhizobium xinjiangense TaxID=2678685 RepID=UPI0012ECE489|nr:acyl-CoA dehydrogenase family protein [Mesorhizobium xinjiangense]
MHDDLDPAEFEDTARAVMASCAGAADVPARARLLGEAGLLGVLAPQATGGLDLPLRYAVPVCRTGGQALLGFPLIETLLLARLLADESPDLATGLVAGETLATIAWTGVVEDEIVGGAPVARVADYVLCFRRDGGALLLETAACTDLDETLSIDVDTPDAALRPGAAQVAQLDVAAVARLRADAKILRAACVHGSAAQCLELAVEHAQGRVQFGRPLSAYQALRHRLSRDALAVETMRNALVRALSEPAEGPAFARDAAWLGAAQAGPGVAESAIQVLGGMGFTWEVPLHRHLRQMRTQAVLGAAVEGLDDLAAHLLNGSNSPWNGDFHHVA